jgi:hypothetical protein
MAQATMTKKIHFTLQKKAKVVGKIKDESGGKPIAEFVRLREKIYSLLIPNEPDKLRCKGVKKSYIKQNLWHSRTLYITQPLAYVLLNYVCSP